MKAREGCWGAQLPASLCIEDMNISAGVQGAAAPALTWEGRGKVPDKCADHPRSEIWGVWSLIDRKAHGPAIDFAGRGAIE